MFKRILTILCGIMLLCATAFAAVRPGMQITMGEPQKPVVVVIYQNNAQLKYNKAVDKKIMKNFRECLPASRYVLDEGKRLKEKLSDNGIEDVYTAERSDVIYALDGENVDYVVFLELQNFDRKEKSSWLTHGIEMKTQAPFKIIDVKHEKYLYSGKIVVKADSTTPIGNVGNRGVVMEAVDKINERVAKILSEKLGGLRTAKSEE